MSKNKHIKFDFENKQAKRLSAANIFEKQTKAEMRGSKIQIMNYSMAKNYFLLNNF